MSLSPRGCAPRHAPMQTEDFSALKSSSFERTYPPHNMWNPSKADVSDVNRPYKLESPSPMKFRRFSRRLSGEESCDTDWISVDEESRFGNDTRQNAMSSYSSDSAQNEQFAEYYHDPRFSRESPDATYPSGFNIQLLKEPLHRNSQSCGVIDQDHLRKLSKSHGSRWTKNHQKALHTWSPRVSSSHRSSRSENQRHRKEHHRRSEPPYRSDARVDLNSPGKPNIQSRNGSPGKRFSSPVKPFDASKCNKTSILAKVLSQSPTNTSSSSKNGDYSKYFSFQGMEEGRLFKSPHKDKNERSALIKILDQKYRKKKKKKKKKNKDRRKSRSRSEERRIGSLDKVYKEEQSPAGGAHLIAPSQGNCTSAPCGDKTESDIKRGRESQTLDSRTVSRSNTLVTRETPDSYICAIVRKRRTSSQDNEGSAVLKFTRVEGQSRKRASPRKSGLAGSMKQDQDSTPTSAKKTERSYASIQAITPPTESEPVAKQNAAHRSSPIKGDFKPKALIKPGLRSTKKETKSADESQRRSPQKKKEKEDSGRRMVQKTLESYFFKSVSEAKTKVQPVKAGPTETVGNADITKCADQGNPNKSHVRRIYCDEAESASRAVVQLTPISEVLISKLRSPKPAAGSAPRGRWGSTPRMAEVRPILSPAKERPESSPPADLAKVASRVPRVTRTTSLESAAPDQPVQPLDELVPEEDLVQAERDQAEAEVTKAAQRNRKRHTRGHKVFAFCDVLQEHIERHPVQNEIPVNKWSKWLNPAQSRCLVSAMLDNTDLCLNFSLDADRNEEWEEYWVKLARRLNTVCFNDLTNLNTGLRMTVSEWKTCWLDLKKTVKTRVDAMTAKERVHNLGSLDCLLYSKDLFTALINSKGECLGDECPKIWCPGACVGVFCPEPVSRTTEE